MADPKDVAVGACQRGDDRLLEEAIADGASIHTPDSEGCFLLHWAAINNRQSIVTRLLELSANPNVIGGVLQSTPLHWSARVGHIAASRLLVQAGAVCNIRDTQGYTPLHLAVQGNHVTLVAYLIFMFETSKNFTDNSGMTPLMWAAYRCYQIFPIRFLINQGVELNAQEELLGNTALHFAVQERNYCAVAELLRGSADISIKNKEHETCLDIARNNRNQKIQKMLHKAARKSGAKSSSCFHKLADDEAFKRQKEFLLPFFYFIVVAILFHKVHYGLASAGSVLLAVLLKCLLGDFSMSHSLFPLAITLVEPTFMTLTWISYVHYYVPWYAQISYPLSIVILFVSLVYIVLSDPGVIESPKNPKDEFIQLVERDEANNFCFSCFVAKPRNSKHCSTCDRCVRNFDHHCPWLNQCVTMRNLKAFLVFVLSVVVSSFVFLVASTILITTEMRTHQFGIILDRYAWLFVTGILAAIHIFLMSTLFCSQIIQISERDTTMEKIRRARENGYSLHRNQHVTCTDRITNIIEFCESQTSVDVQPNRHDILGV